MSEANVECACCGRAVPKGSLISRLRLTAEDMQGIADPADRKPGLRGHCCEKCLATYLPVISRRLGKRVEDMTAHDTY